MSSKQQRSAANKLRTKLILIYLIIFGFKVARSDENSITFQFPEFDYKETSKNELSYREFEVSCEHSSRCENFVGVEKTKCIRQCISPSCYQDIYQFDELEEGEIDVRLNSFKGCFVQRSAKQSRI